MVITHTTIQRPALPLLAHRGITTHIKQSIFRNQRLFSQILRLLPHAVHTGSHFPSVKLLRQIPHIIGHCMQLKKHLILIRTLLKLLPSVLLITHRRLQIALRQIERVVPHRFVVLHLLKRQGLMIRLQPIRFITFQLSRLLITFTFHNTRRQMETRPRQMRVSPLSVQSQHQPSCPFSELRTWHIAVVLILIGMRHLVRKTCIPHKTAMIASPIQRVSKQSVVRLVLRADVRPHFALHRRWCIMQNQHTRHRIRTIHQRGWTLQYLYRADTIAIHFHTMFITPLLTLLSHSFVHHDDAVITQTSDDGF